MRLLPFVVTRTLFRFCRSFRCFSSVPVLPSSSVVPLSFILLSLCKQYSQTYVRHFSFTFVHIRLASYSYSFWLFAFVHIRLASYSYSFWLFVPSLLSCSPGANRHTRNPRSSPALLGLNATPETVVSIPISRAPLGLIATPETSFLVPRFNLVPCSSFRSSFLVSFRSVPYQKPWYANTISAP
jgi:hypothetical protein